jgi:hypothetical protein
VSEAPRPTPSAFRSPEDGLHPNAGQSGGTTQRQLPNPARPGKRLTLSLLKVMAVLVAAAVGVSVYHWSQRLGITAFDRLFPGYASWADSDKPRPEAAAELVFAWNCLIVPAALGAVVVGATARVLQVRRLGIVASAVAPTLIGFRIAVPSSIDDVVSTWIGVDYATSLLAAVAVAVWVAWHAGPKPKGPGSHPRRRLT